MIYYNDLLAQDVLIIEVAIGRIKDSLAQIRQTDVYWVHKGKTQHQYQQILRRVEKAIPADATGNPCRAVWVTGQPSIVQITVGDRQSCISMQEIASSDDKEVRRILVARLAEKPELEPRLEGR